MLNIKESHTYHMWFILFFTMSHEAGCNEANFTFKDSFFNNC